VFATFNFPGGRTATFSSIQSNAFEDAYEMYMGTKATLILTHEVDAYLFSEGEAGTTKVEVSPKTSGPILDSSASRLADSPRRQIDTTATGNIDRSVSYKNEVAEFCAAVRTGSPVRVGAERAMKSAVAIITANRAAEQRAELRIPGAASPAHV